MASIQYQANHSEDPQLEIASGNRSGYKVIHKFGHSDNIGTSLVPISEGLVYQTPTTLQSIEIVSTSADDSAAGIGARVVRVYGITAGWVRVYEDVTMNGTTAVSLSTQFFRVDRAYVLYSGTYSDASTWSHQGNIIIRSAGAGVSWAEILISTSPVVAPAQTNISQYTCEIGKQLALASINIHVETNKEVAVYGFYRDNANVVTAPFSANRVFFQAHALSGNYSREYRFPRVFTNTPSDIGFMAISSAGTSGVGVDFDIIEVDV